VWLRRTSREADIDGVPGSRGGYGGQVARPILSGWQHEAWGYVGQDFGELSRVAVLEKWGWGGGVLEYCAFCELRQRSRRERIGNQYFGLIDPLTFWDVIGYTTNARAALIFTDGVIESISF
jgi:hypothetical protein